MTSKIERIEDNNCSCTKDYTCVMCTLELMDEEFLYIE